MTNKVTESISKLSKMLKLITIKFNNPKLKIKLLVKKGEEATASEIDQIEKWAQENKVQMVKLDSPIEGS